MLTADRTQWTLPNALRRQAEIAPDSLFLQVIGEGTATRGEAYTAALRIAGALAELGVTPGQTVAVMAPTSMPAVMAWLGINMAGAVEVNINGAYKGQTLEHALRTAETATIFIEHRHLADLAAVEAALPDLKRAIVFRLADAPDTPAPIFKRIDIIDYRDVAAHAPLEALPPVAYTDIASMIYTSGTSGPAKAVRMPHAQIYFLAMRTVANLRARPSDVFYCFHPLFHMAGKFMGIFAMLLAGGSIVLDRSFRPETWVSRIREFGATVGLAHGPMLEMIHAQPPQPDDAEHNLKRMIMVPFPRGIAAAFEQRFGLRGIEVWGMTEINAVTWCALDEPLRPGSCGRVESEWYDFRVVDPDTDEELPTGLVGEFVVRPKLPWIIMQGYHGMPEKTVQAWRNLWFHTGDSGYVDEDGYVYFVDRLGDRIRRRAENISSYDIETAAMTHAGIAECAAIGVPSEFDADDDIMLCVVRKPGVSLEAPDLMAHLMPRLPHYMMPRYVALLDALPRTPTNKVQKAKLRGLPRDASIWDRKAAGLSLRDLAQQATR
ncbi:MAG: AMP-binding protein [Pseudolabrys sp.]|nr:AMP-binding protein [Pseudolabrys sp.]